MEMAWGGLQKTDLVLSSLALWSLTTHLSFQQPGVRLHCVELGSGPAVCLCHGFPESWFSWRYQVKENGGRSAPVKVKGEESLDGVALHRIPLRS